MLPPLPAGPTCSWSISTDPDIIRFSLAGSKAVGRPRIGEEWRVVEPRRCARPREHCFLTACGDGSGHHSRETDARHHRRGPTCRPVIWPFNGRTYPKVQIITVAELLESKKHEFPPAYLPYVQARRMTVGEQQSLLERSTRVEGHTNSLDAGQFID
jgi:hypothetical protein